MDAAAATGRARVVGALPGRAHEAAGLAGIEALRRVILQPLEARADVLVAVLAGLCEQNDLI